MKAKSQSVIVSKKKTKKTTTNSNEELQFAWFEKRLIPITYEKILTFCKQLLDWSESGEILSIEEFCMKNRVRHNTLLRWATTYPDLKEAIELAKENIGVFRERGALSRQLSDKTFQYQHMFMARFRSHDDREDKRKIALANEGVTEGSIKIITVNENIKMQEPE